MSNLHLFDGMELQKVKFRSFMYGFWIGLVIGAVSVYMLGTM